MKTKNKKETLSDKRLRNGQVNRYVYLEEDVQEFIQRLKFIFPFTADISFKSFVINDVIDKFAGERFKK
jgi:hypothetical protein